jgi:hypothetical protein
MTSHAQCTHQATPEARRSCRMVRPVLVYAEKLGLRVEQVGDSPLYPQFEVRMPAERDWSTRLLITTGYSTPTVSRRQATGHWLSTPWGPRGRHVVVWLQMMKEDNERGHGHE